MGTHVVFHPTAPQHYSGIQLCLLVLHDMGALDRPERCFYHGVLLGAGHRIDFSPGVQVYLPHQHSGSQALVASNTKYPLPRLHFTVLPGDRYRPADNRHSSQDI